MERHAATATELQGVTELCVIITIVNVVGIEKTNGRKWSPQTRGMPVEESTVVSLCLEANALPHLWLGSRVENTHLSALGP